MEPRHLTAIKYNFAPSVLSLIKKELSLSRSRYISLLDYVMPNTKMKFRYLGGMRK